MKVLWTDSAVAQLQAIHDYLAQTSPDYAARIVDRLMRRSIQIAAFPNSGRMMPEYERKDIREVIEGRYRIIYFSQNVRLHVPNGLNGLPPTARSTRTSIVFFGPDPVVRLKTEPLLR